MSDPELVSYPNFRAKVQLGSLEYRSELEQALFLKHLVRKMNFYKVLKKITKLEACLGFRMELDISKSVILFLLLCHHSKRSKRQSKNRHHAHKKIHFIHKV